MEKTELIEDLTFLLYLGPFIICGLWGLFLTFSSGFSSTQIYLLITKDPTVFLIGFGTVLSAALVEINLGSNEESFVRSRRSARNLQRIALASIVLSVISVAGAASLSGDLGAAGGLLVQGRFAFVFPLLVYVSSVVLSPLGLRRSYLKSPPLDFIGFLLIILSPILLYSLWNGDVAWEITAGVPLLLMVLGLVLALKTAR